MDVQHHSRLSAGAQILASFGLALVTAGVVACYAHGVNSGAGANPLSRHVMPIDGNATRYANLYEAIEHLRPEYLKVHENGSTRLEPVAYLNGVRLADPEMLRHVPTWSTVEVRWVGPNEPSILYGPSHHLGGGIFVKTK
jgi:hypothetical protein